MFDRVFKSIPLIHEPVYAAIAADAAYPDRLIRDRLPAGALSESTQWVFLDDFGRLERIPLDEYDDRLEDFDPRNDGYAEKLRSFFVRGGKRLFFIPLAGTRAVSDTWLNRKQAEELTRSLEASLGDIPFSIELLGREQPLLWYFFLFGMASLGALALSDTPLVTAILLPVLGALVCAGPFGLVLSTALLGLSGIGVFLIRQWDGLAVKAGFLSIVLLGLWIDLFRDIPGIAALPGEGMLGLADRKALADIGVPALVCVFCLLLLGGITESKRIKEALPSFRGRSIRNGSVVPFAVVSFMALYAPIGPVYHEPEPYRSLDAADYERHLAFQRSFSFTPLSHERTGEYRRYRLGEDGLISGVSPYPQDEAEIPPFPLETLIAFFNDFKHTDMRKSKPDLALIIPSLSLLLLTPGECMIRFQTAPQRKKKQSAVYHEKRMAA